MNVCMWESTILLDLGTEVVFIITRSISTFSLLWNILGDFEIISWIFSGNLPWNILLITLFYCFCLNFTSLQRSFCCFIFSWWLVIALRTDCLDLSLRISYEISLSVCGWFTYDLCRCVCIFVPPTSLCWLSNDLAILFSFLLNKHFSLFYFSFSVHFHF